jgi:hypothetical protein
MQRGWWGWFCTQHPGQLKGLSSLLMLYEWQAILARWR